MEINDVYIFCSAGVYSSHTTADHLHEEAFALRRPCEKHRVDIRNIGTFRHNIYVNKNLVFIALEIIYDRCVPLLSGINDTAGDICIIQVFSVIFLSKSLRRLTLSFSLALTGVAVRPRSLQFLFFDITKSITVL